MHVFLISPPGETEFIQLQDEELHHALKVLRCKEGERVELLDGAGMSYLADFFRVSSREAELKIIERNKLSAMPYRLHIAIAPTKMMERFEWFLEKSVEIGISEITPLITSRTERKVVKMQRMEKITRAALKQSRSAFLPVLNQETSFNDLLNNLRGQDAFIAHCLPTEKKALVKLARGTDVTVLIGPEGDFTTDEVTSALKKGCTAVSLGESRLRSETAGIVACSQVHSAHIKDTW
jgi:16S rRNA (uracil1498-N3)-methyltransferase